MIKAASPEEGEEPIAARRSLLGKSAAMWAGHGDHEVAPGWWKALSGAPSVDFNTLVCHGRDLGLVTKSLDIVTGTKAPAVITLAGPGLAGAQVLNDGGWVCIGASQFMVLEHLGSTPLDSDPQVTEAGPDDLRAVWDLVSEAYGVGPTLARVAIPEDVFETPGQSVWLLSVDGVVRSCVATVIIEQSMMVWSMATPPAWQNHGYGRRLLTTALGRSAALGVTESILQSSSAGERLYRNLGYEVAEYWQSWSRPRWVFGRS
jgi:N-acetylglutamate synthase-like GNAT family acetyltransferase